MGVSASALKTLLKQKAKGTPHTSNARSKGLELMGKELLVLRLARLHL